MKSKGGVASPYLSMAAQMIVNNASQVGSQPKNLIQELTMFKEQQRQQMEAEKNVRRAEQREAVVSKEQTSKGSSDNA